jgi:hypothetical protein
MVAWLAGTDAHASAGTSTRPFLITVALAARSAGRIPPLGFSALMARQALGTALSLAAVFGRARRPAVRARPWGAALRVSGLALCATGATPSGTALIAAGSIVPPRSTASHLLPALTLRTTNAIGRAHFPGGSFRANGDQRRRSPTSTT